MSKTIAEMWNGWADESAANYEAETLHVLSNPASAFYNYDTVWKLISDFVPDLKGKKVLVPSSGNNKAAFAFCLLGAEVTSCDISAKQIENAKAFAEKHRLDVRFQVEDTMQLAGVESDAYDFVYTSEGVHVWIHDLPSMYRNIHRVLKPGGVYINYEIHPISRPFEDKFGELAIAKPYDNIMPGEKKHWRMQDILNAVCDAGLTLKRLEEMFDEKDRGHFFFYSDKRAKMSQKKIDAYYDWRKNPQAALPHWFSICAVK